MTLKEFASVILDDYLSATDVFWTEDREAEYQKWREASESKNH